MAHQEGKKRTANFTDEDRTLLMSLRKKPRYFNIIESKKTNAATNQDKVKAWTLLYKEFNSCSAYERDAKSLKSKYENIKKATKKQFADRKLHIRGTGGGPVNANKDKVDEEWLGLLGPQITGNQDEYGGDHDSSESDIELLHIQGIVGATKPVIKEKVNEYHDSSESDIEQNNKYENPEHVPLDVSTNSKDMPGTSFNASKLRQPRSSPLRQVRVEGNNKLLKKIETWAVKKEELAELQKKAFWEDHLNTQKHKQEVHHLQIKQMKALHDLEIKIRTEKWELEKKLLC